MRFSQSLLEKFDSCQLSMQYSIESTARPSGSKRAIGTAHHAGLEHYYMTTLAGRADYPSLGEVHDVAEAAFVADVAEAGEAFLWDEDYPDLDACARAFKGMLSHYFTAQLQDGPIPWPEADWEVLAVEVPFELQHPSNPAIQVSSRGIDLVLRHRQSGWVLGDDHKTTGRAWDQFKHHPRKKAQGPLYVWALQQLFPDAPGYMFAYDIIGYPNKKAGSKNPAGWCSFDRRIATPDQLQIDAALDRVAKAYWLYEKVRAAGVDMPANPSSSLCSQRYCDFFEICPFGKRLSHLAA